MILTLEGVSVSLGGREILHDVGFEIGEGELCGLIGANGTGKTTLMRVVLGLVVTDSGSVRIAGAPRSRRSQSVGYLPQATLLDPYLPLRARDLVALGVDGHKFGIPLPSRRRRELVDEMLAAVDATDLAESRVGRLSGGQQQRVLIAHALVSRPSLLLLDEPLAALDIAVQQEVVSLLARISKEQRIAVLVSTHDMNPLLPVMERIVYIAGGRVASGTTDEVVNSESLSRLYGQHVDVVHVHDRVLVVATSELPVMRRPEHGDVVGLV